MYDLGRIQPEVIIFIFVLTYFKIITIVTIQWKSTDTVGIGT